MQRKRILLALCSFIFLSTSSFILFVTPLLQSKARAKLSGFLKEADIDVTFQEVKLVWNGIRVLKLEVSRGDDRLQSDVIVTFGLSTVSPFFKPRLVTFDRPKILMYRNQDQGSAKSPKKTDTAANVHGQRQSLNDLLDRYFTAGVSVAFNKASVKVFDSKNLPLLIIPQLNLKLNARDRTAQISTSAVSFRQTPLLSQMSGQILMQKQREFYPFLLQASDPDGEPWQLKGQVQHDFESIDIRHKRVGLPLAWLPKLRVIGNPNDVQVLVRLKLDGLMSQGEVNYDVKVASNNLFLQHEKLGKAAFGPWPFSIHSRGVFNPETATLNVTQGALYLIGSNDAKPLLLNFSGSKQNLQASMQEDPLTINFSMEHSSCQTAFHAIPQSLLPTLKGLELDGTFAIDGTLHLVSSENIVSFTPNLNHIACHITRSPEYLTRDWLFRGTAPLPDFLANNPSMRAIKNGHPTPRHLIPDDFFKGLVAAEDAKFWHHDGILIPSLVAALQANMKAGHIVFGGSTITMQLAKNLYLDRDKVISRKIQEIAIAWVLEQNLSKAEILELYANAVEFAPGTYGIGRAAALYFNKAVHDMSSAESLFLASILPSPSKNFTESYCSARLSRDLSERMQKVANGLNTLSQEQDFLKIFATDFNNFHFSSVLQGCDSRETIGLNKKPVRRF